MEMLLVINKITFPTTLVFTFSISHEKNIIGNEDDETDNRKRPMRTERRRKDTTYMRMEEQLKILLGKLAEETTLHGFKQIHNNQGIYVLFYQHHFYK